MFDITLYSIEKAPNSTKRPDTSGMIFNCICRDESSVIDPIIEIEASLSALLVYNYAYIKDWGRYYRISDIVAGFGGIVRLYLQVDVLASFRSQILMSYQYVTRSASDYDGNIIDHYYATLAETSSDYEGFKYSDGVFDVLDVNANVLVPNYFTRAISSGEFVIGVIGENSTGITYYALNYTNFKNLLNALMAYTPSNMNDVSTGIAKVLADPMQYITTCFWIPYAGQTAESSQTIKFGYYSITATANVLNASDYIRFRTFVDVPKHPQAATRGAYLNGAPFSSYSMLFNPFGMLQLDTVRMISATKLKIEWYYDCTKGNGELFVMNNTTDEIVYHGYADMLAVPIQLSQLTVNSLQTGTSLMDTIGSALRFDIGGIFSSIGNAVESQQPKVSRHGSEGSFLNYRVDQNAGLFADFIRVVDEDLQNIGRPLCARVQLANLSGYTECGNPSIHPENALAKESEMIENYLRDGFFIE